jgi:hypothetical protein
LGQLSIAEETDGERQTKVVGKVVVAETILTEKSLRTGNVTKKVSLSKTSQKYKTAQTTQTFHQSKFTMKLNLLLLSAAALINAATAADVVLTVNLRSAGDYTILAKTGISTVPQSSITGNIAVSPIAAEAVTGFGELVLDSTGTFSKDATEQLVGEVHASNYVSPTPNNLITAVSDMMTAYTDAAGRSTTSSNINLGAGIIGGLTLTTGVYTFDRNILIGSATELTFSGSDTDIFIIKTTGSVVQAANTKVILKDGALAENIFWQVAGEFTVEAGAHMEGVLLVMTTVVFVTGSSLNGRILTQTACDLQMATITEKPGAPRPEE